MPKNVGLSENFVGRTPNVMVMFIIFTIPKRKGERKLNVGILGILSQFG